MAHPFRRPILAVETREEVESIPNVYQLKKSKTAPVDTAEPEEESQALDIPNDTLTVIRLLCSKFPNHRFPIPISIIFKSQIYYSLVNKTLVERELSELERNSIIRIFSVDNSGHANEIAIVLISDLMLLMDKIKLTQNSPILKSIMGGFLKLLTNNHRPYIGHEELKDFWKDASWVYDDIISSLTHVGLLGRRDSHSFWFTIPNFGAIYSWMLKGRKYIADKLKSKKFNEMMESDLLFLKIKNDPFDMLFHLKDAVGMDLVVRYVQLCFLLSEYKRGTNPPLSKNLDAFRGQPQQGLKTAASNPPYNASLEHKKRDIEAVVSLLCSFKEQQIAPSLADLSADELDVLLKYVYKGLESGNNSAVLFKWFAALQESAGLGSIVRVMTDANNLSLETPSN